MTARSRLRESTRPDHGRVDRLFSRFDLADRSAYLSFLTALASAHLAIEDGLDAAGAARIVDDWPGRRRGNLLRADLADLGAAVPGRRAAPPLDDDAAILGAVYVLEGSRLGGAMLSSRVAPDASARFLTAHRPGSWRNLLALLDARLDSPASLASAVAAARSCFFCFEQAARLELEPVFV